MTIPNPAPIPMPMPPPMPNPPTPNPPMPIPEPPTPMPEPMPITQSQNLTEADALVLSLIQAMENKTPTEEVINQINIAVYRTPELGESIDELLNLDTEHFMTLLSAYNPAVRKIEGAREWLEKLIEALTKETEETEETEEMEPQKLLQVLR